MSWVAEALFPARSIAVWVAVVVPSGNTEPLDGALVRESSPEMLKSAVTVNPATAPDAPVAIKLWSAGGLMMRSSAHRSPRP